MKLAFYSTLNKELNKEMDLSVKGLLTAPNLKFTYIPSASDPSRHYFNIAKEYFADFEFSSFEYFDIDSEFDPSKMNALTESDVVYLSGGQTFTLLNNIKNKNILNFLINFAKSEGKVLIGASAGAMVMTPSVEVTAYFHRALGDYKNYNQAQVIDFSGLSLVDFEFFPHFTKEKLKDIEPYLKVTKNTVYGCYDNGGIVVNGDETTLVGHVDKLN